MTPIQSAWEVLMEDVPRLLTAAEIKQRTGLEPRLMAKFDHRSQLPPALARHGLFLLPVRNGHYALVPGDGYHTTEPCPAAVDFPSRAEFALRTASQGASEMQYLDLAYNSGMLSHFLEVPTLYPTIRGRKRSPRFELQVSGQSLVVEGVQVEVDGGYEGPDCVVVVEAKIDDPPDFHLRQLYYPFRFWSLTTPKPVRCIFFTYSPPEGIYRLREYRFEPADVYRSPRLVKAAAYRLVARPGRLPCMPADSSVRIPQADDLDKIALLPFLVAQGSDEAGAVARAVGFTPRQASYYRQACEMLGLLSTRGHRFVLGPRGQRFVELGVEARNELLSRAVLELPIMRQLVVEMLLAPDRRVARSTVEELIRCSSGLSGSTVSRRAGTIWRWFAWLERALGFVHVEAAGVELVTPPAHQALSLF